MIGRFSWMDSPFIHAFIGDVICSEFYPSRSFDFLSNFLVLSLPCLLHGMSVGVGSNASPASDFTRFGVRVFQPFRLIGVRVPQPFP